MKPTRESLLKIVNASARVFCIKPKEIYGSGRSERQVDARSCAMYLASVHITGNQSEIARMGGFKVNNVNHGVHRIKDAIDVNDVHSNYIRAKLTEIEQELGIKETKALKSEDLNCLAGCNIAGRIRVAMSLIGDKEFQRAKDELEDLLHFVNAPQHHTAKVVIETKDGLGEVKEQPDYIHVEFVKQ
jgi:hypothetical protein